MSLELQLALAPGRTYRQLVAAGAGRGWRALAAPLLFTFVTTGTVVAILATRRVGVEIVGTTSLTSSFSLVIQMVAALALIASAPARGVGVSEALALFFRAHWPWSAWMLSLAPYAFVTNLAPSLRTTAITLMVPLGWSAVITAAFAREVLGTSRRGAYWRTAMHVAIVWFLALAYIAWAAGGWIRIAEALLS